MKEILKIIKITIITVAIMTVAVGGPFAVTYKQQESNTTAPYYNYKYEIVQITNIKNTEGRFFLGSRNIKNEMYYYMYIKNQDNSLTPFKVCAENAHDRTFKIFQDSDKAYIESKYIFDGKLKWFRSNIFGYQQIELHVPKNTIVDFIDININNF